MDLQLGDLSNWLTQERIDLAIAMALNVVYAIIILIVALFASGWARRRITRIPERNPRLDPTLFGFLGSLAKYGILALAGVFILNRFGIQTASLVALIGAAGLAIGLALQGTLSNLAAGVMLILFRPFRVGDYVEISGVSGTVREVALFFTELATADNLQVILPNGDVWANKIVNYSANPTRRVDLTIGVSYDTDLKRAETVLRDIVTADPRVHADPEPFIKVKALGDSSVDFAVRAWVDRADWWDTTCDLTRAIKDRLDAEGIDIPYPTRTILMPGNQAA
ncbi:small conductance mechanosensitive channel [Albidovulum inexpectatum]|uniref:Small-conductance mechanosensitive channel n=1 Tax=Albidovulum inexpectatum TaxID=196587 RepID=A0A2S5JLR4_9RHOB|nr:mechanosensitive ion channel domain-containing protein [Albidovulum inexpectatum]PPB82390.1 small conductance mechanosensitive channel [Albidovulum inexpectatum]